jgi:AraC family transcriptional regulator
MDVDASASSSTVYAEARVISVLCRLLGDADEAMERDWDAARACIRLAATIIRTEFALQPADKSSSASRGGLAPWQLLRAKSYISENLHRTIKIEALGHATQLSAGYFSRAFKRSVGRSPQSYISLARLRRAQEMMLATDQPLSQIALACGFYDQAHLCKVFRRFAAESPNAWRRGRLFAAPQTEVAMEHPSFDRTLAHRDRGPVCDRAEGLSPRQD